MTNVSVVMMVKNEMDILPHILKHLQCEEIDDFFIWDNNSNDGTYEFLKGIDDERFHIAADYDPAYYQSVKMNKWIDIAVEQGAEIILPIDADELWYSLDPNLTLGGALRLMEEEVALGHVWDMIPTRKDFDTKNPLLDIVHREPYPEKFPVVAYKYAPGSQVTQGNHDVIHNGARNANVFEVKHFQYRSWEQFKMKLRQGKKAYDATDLPFGEGYHWRTWGALSDEDLWKEWVGLTTQEVVYDPAPAKGQRK